MHILLTGGTGLIGRSLCKRWLADGHRLSVLSRRPDTVAERCGPAVHGVGSLQALGDDPVDAVVNLAGAPIADRPWTGHRRKLLWASRVSLTEQLLAWLGERSQRPSVLISGSAVGWYGDGGQRELTEASGPVSEDFASQLCIAWEETAERAAELGLRVVLVRTGLVLSGEGGMLARMAFPFRLGLGGRLGTGRQWMPWVHIDDQIALIDFLLNREGASGPYNACSPHPVRNREFVQRLGKALRRPALVPLPESLLRLALGEMAGLLLGGQKALPQRLLEAGFVFRHSDLQAALDNVFSHH
ncbi:TIGR01777 family oxidoreductase [Pseudomonas typographi]|uniref:TIGR01777 family protein n=1 Tax=Pseudomonas typographi TaxID=2715964 RepID=A0ABR7YYR7_9PSED|nr:TIGR01777 family oxidoreductase [Pseudomonas typographi]MBD1550888.1 TIGR01777 family protein [Pseudomonas typographi]MBD1589126.1 TIGR01777 family protein [Pseudomonas typographi]MBD1598353.1 TIGR01777 family protein [Pseudomonas typographi]